METGVIIALLFAAVVIVVAVVATRMIRGSPKQRYDLNASRRDADATATWVGIERDIDDGPQNN